MKFLLLLLVCFVGTSSLVYRDEIVVEKEEMKDDGSVNAYSPLVECHFL